MFNPELPPFLQSIARGTVKIKSEEPLSLAEAVRDSLNNLRLRIVELLETQGEPRTGNELVDTWASHSPNTPLPLLLRSNHPRSMGLRRYHVAKKTLSLDPTAVLDLNLYSFGPRLPRNVRSVMIVVPSIADLRGFLILSRIGNPPTQDTYGRLLVTHAPYPQRSSPSFVRFVTPTDEGDFGELVSLYEEATLIRNNGASQMERFHRRYPNLAGERILTPKVF